MAKAKQQEDPGPGELYVYLGRRLASDRTLCHVIVPHEHIDSEDDHWHTFSGKIGMSVVGGVYETWWSEDGKSLYHSGSKRPAFKRKLTLMETALAEWQMHDQSAKDAHAAIRLERNLAKSSELDRLIAPLQRMYWNTNGATRRAMLVEILRRIQDPSGRPL